MMFGNPQGELFLDFFWFKVHYHIIPAPPLDSRSDRSKYDPLDPPTEKEMHAIELEGRTELDEDFAKEFTDKMRRELAMTTLSHL